LGFPFSISATTEDSDFKIDRLVGFAKAHHKILPRRKRGRGLGLGELSKIWGFHLIFMQWLKVLTSNLYTVWVANYAHHKITQMTKVGLDHGMLICSLQNYASPFDIFAMAEVAMDVPNKRYYIEKLQILM